MLAQIRKFNPHDALRRGGTFTKFVGGGIGQLQERSFGLGNQVRSGMEDDYSDATSNCRGSPQNSRRSSARALGRVQHLPNRPNTGNNRHNAGGHYAYKAKRSSNIGSTAGRKFDYNPTRSRANEFVSSSPVTPSSFLQNTADSQIPYALYSTSYEGIITPPNIRSHHSRSDMPALPPLESQERARSRSQPPQFHQHNGNSLPLENDFYTNDAPTLIRQSSNLSLSTNSSDGYNINSVKSSNLEVKLQTPKLPAVKNTSSFLATPRSPFSLRKSYTDLYFSATYNKEIKSKALSNKIPFTKRTTSDVGLKKHSIK